MHGLCFKIIVLLKLTAQSGNMNVEMGKYDDDCLCKSRPTPRCY